MQHPISLSVFFPAHNEAANIQQSLEEALSAVRRLFSVGVAVSAYEIIVVNDGSRDGTKATVEEYARRHPEANVRLVDHDVNRGYGAALKSGIREARHEYVFFTDADLQFNIAELERLFTYIGEYDVVIGYRAPRRDSFMRLVNAWGWRVLNRILFGLSVRDIDCAFKLFRRDLVQELPLRSEGAMVSAEMLIRLKRLGARIKEVPVTHLPRTRGAQSGARPSVILRALREMVQLYFGELGSVTHKQALKFIVVGFINTAVDITAYYLLTRYVPLFAALFVAAKFLSFLVGTVSSFLLNRYWTFGLRSGVRAAEVARFYMTVSAALLVNTGSMYLLVSLAGLYDLFALIFVTVLTFAFNFTLSKLWVFRQSEEPNATSLHTHARRV